MNPNSWGAEISTSLIAEFPDSACTYLGTLPAREAKYIPWPEWVYPPLRQQLVDKGVRQLYEHQARAATAAWEGHHVVLATGTSSGKSLAYQLPVLSKLAQDVDPLGCALYLTPTKALGSDQLRSINQLCQQVSGLETLFPAPYDGDTEQEIRAGIREHSRYILSNPDMLHTGILRNHQRFARFFRHLRFVIIDECHTYRGVFGANIALVLQRLRRIAQAYGADPVFILASATANDPAAQAAKLIGVDITAITAITNDAAPHGERTLMLWQPAILPDTHGVNGAPVRRAATSEAADLMASLIGIGARTITFVRSRRSAEVVALRTAESLRTAGRADDATRVAAYRAGYLAEDRRRLEKDLEDGSLLGVATTSALELGVDIGGLDAVVTAGYPGTIASFWQQAGRAGRRGQGSLVVFVARDEPLDNYLAHHPEALLGRPVEKAVFNPQNPYILRGHLYCAALEKPLSPADLSNFGAHAVAEALVAEGYLRRRANGWLYPAPFSAAATAQTEFSPDTAHSVLNLRGSAANEVLIADATDGRLLGTISADRAPGIVHPGAVYLHQGESFLIDELDLAGGVALAHPEEPAYATFPRSETNIRILSEPNSTEVYQLGPGVWVSNVEVEVTNRVTSYVMKYSGDTPETQVPLDMPAHILNTRAVAYTVDPLVLSAMGITDAAIPGTLHAAEHAAIGLLPLIATCDRWDIGGVSTALHQDTLLPTVFVYDGNPGGAGFADEGFRRFKTWITATFEAVRSCECTSGCPSCVQSPKCGNGNNPLDKAGAIKLLSGLVSLLDS
ncbi:DEAD/DEAH box helicase [Corynebacterium caspium]|uniref:DEAD/DEAH box helicase n=1 Tax=Corynebacterium caspium TaxID=234828 RepID=UPI000685A233|nr:DEAD/DEAH box helicase [Corynebacterium caspium]